MLASPLNHQERIESKKSALVGPKQKMVVDPCYRCKRPTFFNDKIGPLKDGVVFHKGCFKCWICGSRLSLKSYFNNRNDTQDMEVYCAGHVPSPEPHAPIPHRSNLLYSPKTKGEYTHNLMRPGMSPN